MADTNEQSPLLQKDGPCDSHSRCRSSTSSSHPLTTSQLKTFRNAIGINITSRSADPHELEMARSKPSGLYKEIIAIQRSRNRQYYIIEYFYYFALVLQILIGAFLASLGSLSSTHPLLITVLGVLNTATAGILALLKGQGLPDRLRKDAYEMKKVQDFIEEADIRLSIETKCVEGEVGKLVERVFELYNTARDTAEMNHPSNYAHQVDGSEAQPPQSHGNGPVGHDGVEDGDVGGGNQGVGIRGVQRWETNGSASSTGKAKFVME